MSRAKRGLRRLSPGLSGLEAEHGRVGLELRDHR